MSTRGYVGRLNEDGSVDAIYNHFDSYFDGLGKDLLKDFNTKEKVDELIARGDGSYVSNATPYEDATPHHFASKEEYLDALDNDVFIEYIYLFVEGMWYAKNHLCGKRYVSSDAKGFYWDLTLLSEILNPES